MIPDLPSGDRRRRHDGSPGTDRPESTPLDGSLRLRAERLLRMSRANVAMMPPEDLQALVHELQVHQIELELQNENLRETQHELAQSRDRYSDLYEFAPVGYLSIDGEGKILKANLTSATILGVERSEMLGQNLSHFVARDSQDVLYHHLRGVVANEHCKTCDLTMRRPDDRPCVVRLESNFVAPDEQDPTQCRSALIDITWEMEAESWANEAKRLELMVENLPAGAVFIDHQSVQLNQAAERITGYSRDEIVTLDEWFSKLFGSNDQDARRIHARNHSAGFPTVVSATITRKDGVERIVEFAGHCFDDHEVWLLHDVTEQRDANEMLMIQERAIQSVQNGIVISDATKENHPIIFCNAAMESITGYSPSEFIGRSCWFQHADERDQDAVKALRQTIKRGSHGRMILRNRRKDGTLFWNELTFSPIYKADGKLTHFVTIQNDISERLRLQSEQEQANELLKISEERLSLALQVTNNAIWDWDIATNLLWWNETFRREYGEPEPGVDPAKWAISRIHPDDRNRFMESLKAFIARAESESEPWLMEYRIRKVDGNYAIVQGRTMLRTDGKGKAIRVLGAMDDQTQRRYLEKQVLTAAGDENRRIAQNLHDGIGQELTGIGMLADALFTALSRRESPEAKTAKQLHGAIQRTMTQVQTLARGMDPVDVDGKGLAVAITQMCERMSELHGIQCRWHCPPHLELKDNQIATQLFRIAQEATTNAIKHGKASLITISLNDGQTTSSLPELCITDNGVGIEETIGETQGMGMRTMQYRAGVIGGRLTVSRSPGGGTCVTCLFPRDALSRI